MTFDAFVSRYLNSMRQTQRRSEKTIEAYSRDLKQAVAFFGESADIQSLDTLSVIGWVRALSVKNIAGRSICEKLSALRGLFKEAVNQKDYSDKSSCKCSRSEGSKISSQYTKP